MYKIQKSIDEACGIFQLRVVTDVLIQNSHGWLRDQVSVKTTAKEKSVYKISNHFILKHWDENAHPEGHTVFYIFAISGWDLLVETDELRMGIDWIQGAVDHVHWNTHSGEMELKGNVWSSLERLLTVWTHMELRWKSVPRPSALCVSVSGWWTAEYCKSKQETFRRESATLKHTHLSKNKHNAPVKDEVAIIVAQTCPHFPKLRTCWLGVRPEHFSNSATNTFNEIFPPNVI